MRLGVRRLAVACLTMAVLAAPASRTQAHDFGSLSINVYSRLTLEESQISIRWVLDMAEIPAGAIVTLIDKDGNGAASQDEQDAYFATWLSSVLDQIHLIVDGTELSKDVDASTLELPVGENGARYLRVTLDLLSDLPPPAGGEYLATYQDQNYAEFIGWREVVVAASPQVELLASTVAEVDRTNQLQTYPPDLGATTPNSDAEFSFRIAPAPSGEPRPQPAAPSGSRGGDDLLALGLLLLAVVAVVASAFSGLGARRRARRGAGGED